LDWLYLLLAALGLFLLVVAIAVLRAKRRKASALSRAVS